jgi:hypothetical protein
VGFCVLDWIVVLVVGTDDLAGRLAHIMSTIY